MRRSPSRLAICIGLVLLSTATWPVYQLWRLTAFGDPYNEHLLGCNVGEDVRRELLRAGKATLGILSRRNVTAFLCYGSLWAYLRRGGLFPWQHRLKLCTVTGGLDSVDAEELRLEFSRANLDIAYERTEAAYAVRDQKFGRQVSRPGHVVPEVLIVLWQLNEALRVNGERENVYRRMGWRHRLLPPGSEALEEFPERLIDAPLRLVTFSGLPVAIPHEGVELQKYHYKDDWWTEVKPPACSKAPAEH